MQYTEIFFGCKIENFIGKKFDIIIYVLKLLIVGAR